MNHLSRTVHDRVPIRRHRPKSLTGGRGRKNLKDGWPLPSVVEDKQRQIFPYEPITSIFPIAIIDTVVALDEKESKRRKNYCELYYKIIAFVRKAIERP